jgi:hypothetical protein
MEIRFLDVYGAELAKQRPNHSRSVFHDQITTLSHGRDKGTLDYVVSILLEVYVQQTDPEIRAEVLAILRNCRKPSLVNYILYYYGRTQDAQLLEIVPKGEFWELAGEIKPFCVDTMLTQYDLQIGLEELVNDPSKRNHPTLEAALNAFVETDTPQLKEKVKNLLHRFKTEAEIDKSNSYNYDIISQYWEDTGDPELEKFIPSTPHRETATQLAMFFNKMTVYRIERNIHGLLSDMNYLYGTFLSDLLQTYKNTTLKAVKTNLIQVFRNLLAPNYKSAVFSFWKQNKLNFDDIADLILDNEYGELAQKLAGKIPNYYSQYQLRLELNGLKDLHWDLTFTEALLKFATSQHDRELRLEVLKVLSQAENKSYIFSYWQRTGHPDLDAFLPQDEMRELTTELIKIYPNKNAYDLWIALGNYDGRVKQPYLTNDLLRVAVGHEDATFRQRVLNFLGTIKHERDIAEICNYWLETRHPDLDKLITEQNWKLPVVQEDKFLSAQAAIIIACKLGTIYKFHKLSNREMRILAEATLDSDPTVAANAIARLKNYDESYLPQFAVLWKETRAPVLLDIMLANDFVPEKPAETRLAMAVLLNRTDGVIFDKPELVPILAELAEQDNAIGERAQELLKRLKKAESRRTLCQLLIETETELPQTQQIALQMGITPDEPAQKAVYYFLTEQWAKYDELDFDRRYLAAAYQNFNTAQKRRLAAKIRASGRIEYLEALSGRRGDSQTDAETLVEMLATSQNWAKLWAAVQELPLAWSVAGLEKLRQAGWRPENGEEAQLFAGLTNLLEQGVTRDTLAATKTIPPAYQRLKVNVKSKVSNLAFSPMRPVLALAAGKKVVLWNLQDGKIERTLTNFNQKIGRVAFMPDGTLICTEAASSGPSSVYAWQNGELSTIGEHNDAINFLAVVDEKLVLTGGRDFYVRLWDIQKREHIASYQTSDGGWQYYNNWVRGGCLTPDKKRVAILGNQVMYLGLPGLELQHSSNNAKAQLAAFAPDGNALVTGRGDGKLRIYERGASGEYRGNPTVLDSPGLQESQPKGLAVLPEFNRLISAGRNGKIEFLDWATRRGDGGVEVASGKINSLTLSPDNCLMAVGEDESHFSLWDLGGLQARRLFEISLAQAQIGDTVTLAALLEKESGVELPPDVQNACRYIQTVLKYRFRFAIELDATPHILAGEFDIEF